MRVPRNLQEFRSILSWEEAWLFLALAVRVAFALKLGGRQYQIDEGRVDPLIWSHLSSSAHVLLPKPGLNLFCACFYALFGYDRLFPRLGQAVLGTLTVWMVGRMTAELSLSPRAGRWSLAISAVYPFFVYYSGMLMSETLYLAAIVPGLWWLCSSLVDGGRAAWKAPAAGLALSLAAFSRSEGAAIALLIWAGALIFCWRKRWPWRAWALAVLCWALPLAGWAAYLKAETGGGSPDTHGGLTLLMGTMFLNENEQDTQFAFEALRRAPFYAQAMSLGAQERDAFYYRQSFLFMREHPGEMAGQWARKFVNFWRFYPRRDKAFLIAEGGADPSAGLRRWMLVVISLCFEPWLILLGLAGLWKLARRPSLFPIPLFVLGTMGVHLISVSQMRYRLPVMPFLILGACSLLAGGQLLRKA